MCIDDNEALFKFVDHLIAELDGINMVPIAKRLIRWKRTVFTTGSEFLGELKLILKSIDINSNLSDEMKMNIVELILSINLAFDRANEII